MRLELEHIDYNKEDLKAIIRALNDRMDSIVLAYNQLVEETNRNTSSTSEVNESTASTTRKKLSAKNIKMGLTDASTVKNTTVYVDQADGSLNYINPTGTITQLAT